MKIHTKIKQQNNLLSRLLEWGYIFIYEMKANNINEEEKKNRDVKFI